MLTRRPTSLAGRSGTPDGEGIGASLRYDERMTTDTLGIFADALVGDAGIGWNLGRLVGVGRGRLHVSLRGRCVSDSGCPNEERESYDDADDGAKCVHLKPLRRAGHSLDHDDITRWLASGSSPLHA
jgi:hypothetical protein